MTDKQNAQSGTALTRSETEFAHRAGRQLQDSADTLDGETLSRLNRARQHALEQIQGEHRTTRGWWAPAGAVTAAAAVAILIWQTDDQTGSGEPAIPVVNNNIADIELILGDGDLEMIEDLEFFAWLATDVQMNREAG